MKVLVVPSNRESCLREFLVAWEGRGGWDETVVIEDGPERTFSVPGARLFCWADIERVLGENAWIVSKRDSAIRCFGFLAAWWAGAEHVLTLDDDCYPEEATTDFFGCHLDALTGHRRWASSVPGVRIRGLPYANLGTLPDVVANVGLWMGHPDFDAATSLTRLWMSNPNDIAIPHANWIIPCRQYVPTCGMNLCLAHDALPLFYFPLQGQGQPYRRFDDIWAGIIAKKVCDHLGWSISVGEPFIEHRRASDPFVNLVKESPGIAANELFWQTIDNVLLTATTATGCMAEMGEWLQSRTHGQDVYVRQLGKALQVWARLFEKKPEGL